MTDWHLAGVAGPVSGAKPHAEPDIALTADGGVSEAWTTRRIRAGLARGSRASSGRMRYLVSILALAGCYYGTAQFGFTLQFTGPVAAIVWLPVGVGVAGLYLGGLELWPGVLVGDLVTNYSAHFPLGISLLQAAGNVLEVVVAVVLLRRLVARRGHEATLQGVAGTAVAIAAGAAVSATIGCIATSIGGMISGNDILPTWRTWWLGDFSGALVIVPAVIAWRTPSALKRRPAEVAEGALVLGIVVLSSVIAWAETMPLTYVVFPALILAAVRLRFLGAAVAAAIASAFAIWGTVHWLGPFDHVSLERGVLQTQLFIAVATFSTLCLAAVMAERRRLADGLSASRLRLVQAAESEQRRLALNLHDGAQQRLAALMVRLNLDAGRVRADPAGGETMLRAARSELGEALDELRALAHGSHPPLLAERGLAAVIDDMAARSPVPIETDAMPDFHLPESAEASAYYVIAEAVTNALKHAHAAAIRVSVRPVGGSVVVDVSDDGAGGAIEAPGSGLEGLRDRLEAVGGGLSVVSQAGCGTRIAATIPILPSGSSG